METKEILKKVRKIEIKTRKLSKNIFAGQYHSKYKGRGMTFSEVREYQYGDDIRSIDWNVTARYNHPYVKVFEEERQLTVILMIDVSASGNFGSFETKRDYITEIAAVLAFSAISNNDKIGVILFSDRIEKFIPPQKGKKQILLVIRELLAFEPQGKSTNLSVAFEYLANTIKKRATVFVMSDFLSSDYTKALRVAAYKHDISTLFVYDKLETTLPNVGLVNAYDPETGRMRWIDTSSKKQRAIYEAFWNNHSQKTTELLNRCNVDYILLSTDEDYIKPLVQFFKNK